MFETCFLLESTLDALRSVQGTSCDAPLLAALLRSPKATVWMVKMRCQWEQKKGDHTSGCQVVISETYLPF